MAPKKKVKRKKRPNPRLRPSKPDRIAHIVRLMAANEWVTGKSHLELTKRWTMSIPELGREVAEASRQIKALVATDPEVMDRIKVGLEWAADQAKAMAKRYGKSHPSAAVQAVKAYSEACRVLVAGAQSWARAEAESRATEEPERFKDLSDEELSLELTPKK